MQKNTSIPQSGSLIDMESDSYRLRETLRNNGTDFETVVK